MSEATTIESQIEDFDPNDPEALAALENQLLSGDEVPVESGDLEAAEKEVETKAKDQEDEEKAGAEDGDSKQDDKAEEAKGDASATQDEEPVVLTKSGNHTIPYQVLVDARERASQMEAQVTELTQQLEAMKEGGKAEKAAGDSEIQIELLSEEALAELDELGDEIGDTARKQQQAIRVLSAEIAKLKGEREAEKRQEAKAQQDREQEMRDEISAAIAANKTLSSWREAATRVENPDSTMWQKAYMVDQMLLNSPEWADSTNYSERFAKVVEVVGMLYGGVDKPPSASQSDTKETQADLKEAADAKLKEKGSEVPISLSDIPGGAAPAQSDVETLENASSVAIGQKFMDMTPEQIESYLARFG